jgi:hypothetical protein
MHSIDRIATYVAGDVHQYPASLPIARRLTELCADTGYAPCQERLATTQPYDYGLGEAGRKVWRARFAGRTSIGLHNAAWAPATWSSLDQEWKGVKRDILEHGASSVGTVGHCSTSTPWCRSNPRER